MLINDKTSILKGLLVALIIITNIVVFPAKAAAAYIPVKSCLTPLGQFAAAKHLTPRQLYSLLKVSGFKGYNLKVAWAVVMKETHGNPLAHNYNPHTGDNSYGIFQINLYGALKYRVKAYGLKSAHELTNPVRNAEIAYELSSGGTDWSPWHANRGERDRYLVNYWLKQLPTLV